jgi:hypothetical protein
VGVGLVSVLAIVLNLLLPNPPAEPATEI